MSEKKKTGTVISKNNKARKTGNFKVVQSRKYPFLKTYDSICRNINPVAT